ncbi:SDR family NAD(P)-dependent oxidoreductase [Dysgonomonas sp. 520]|uniref:SDR family NAD(P)-dependent oxidoreductase n=1 Tax=Dysgonomonas sp. 520 TaxID=2302931 RepID=UPI0013D193A7|nr:SDR family oxidoreductase [Dysgonomonas sp. 520]NDW10567.1 SDR family oxidoreductase [Dysgonomonas sp. 520]
MKNDYSTPLNGKTVFVTGGANGIGKAIVESFCKEKANVIFCDIDEQASQALCFELKDYSCSFLKVDASSKEDLTKAMTDTILKYGDIDILINNVGVSTFSSILETSIEEFEQILNINLRSVFITSKLLAEHREKQNQKNRYGRIINMASTRYLMSEPDTEAYSASKGGVASLTHSLSMSLSRYHITVNCISPGWIDTGHYGELKKTDHSQHPSGRVGIPEDIARMCIFLCHPDNDFINAQNFTIDGGMTKKMIYFD